MKVDKEQREHFCQSLRAWSDIMIKREKEVEPDGSVPHSRDFARAAGTLDMAIHKSCLLDRMIYCGEKPSQTPCPVHKGQWSGCHWGWPGCEKVYADGTREPAETNKQCQEWYDAGCRCFQHGCGCTTGWQPDEHCGCKESE